MLDLSTGHISRGEDLFISELIERGEADHFLGIRPREYGYLLTRNDKVEEAEQLGLQGIADIMKLMRELGETRAQLDRDGCFDSRLKEYEWEIAKVEVKK